MSPIRIHGATAALSILALLATACGSGDETPAPASQPSAAETPAQATPPAATAEIPEVQILQGEAPETLPDGVPKYPNAKPETSLLIPGRGGLVTFSSGDAVADVIGYYQQQLADQGWNIDKVDEQELRTRLTATREGRLLDVVAAQNGDNTEIMINTQDAG